MRLLVYKTLYLCLAALLLFSAVMTGTLAWQDISQHKTNEFRGAGDVTLPDRGSVVLHKYEKAAVVENPDGENQGEDENGGGAPTPPAPLRGVRFALIRRNADGSETQMGYYLTGNDGAIQVDGLEPGDYYFLELRPPFGYDYDLDDNGEPVRRYPFTIRAGSQEAVQVTAYNRRRTGQVHITKTVENLSGEALSEEQREIAFTFTVTFSDGGAYTYMVDGGEEKVISSGGTILLRHGETATILGIPVGVQYTVTETPVEGYVVSSSGHQGTVTGQESLADFKNLLCPPCPNPTKLIVKKLVKGNGADLEKEFRFVVRINGEETRFTLKDNESREFTLPPGASYLVLEEDPYGDGYVQSAVFNGQGSAADKIIEVVFTNTFIGEEVITIEGEKTWKVPAETVLPASIVVELLGDGKLVQAVTVTPDSSGRWRYSFTAPKYDEDGGEIQYTVRERALAGYKATVKGYDIENLFVPPSTVTSTTQTDTTCATAQPSTATSTTQTGTTAAKPTTKATGSSGATSASTTKPAPKPGGNVKTSDSSNIWLWTALMIGSAFGLRFLVLYQRKAVRRGKP